MRYVVEDGCEAESLPCKGGQEVRRERVPLSMLLGPRENEELELCARRPLIVEAGTQENSGTRCSGRQRLSCLESRYEHAGMTAKTQDHAGRTSLLFVVPAGIRRRPRRTGARVSHVVCVRAAWIPAASTRE
ncbi:MAG: hypothetical protein A2Z30_08345 [Chloroflexi bacterium RBG_16_64_43]|nr:MAG: hypothetical protein A2Z30_08345 [Chloroflexi bacterium RBG_16_64_43]